MIRTTLVFTDSDEKHTCQSEDWKGKGVEWGVENDKKWKRAESREFWNLQSCWTLKLPPAIRRDQLADPLSRTKLQLNFYSKKSISFSESLLLSPLCHCAETSGLLSLVCKWNSHIQQKKKILRTWGLTRKPHKSADLEYAMYISHFNAFYIAWNVLFLAIHM